jgi:hypothetical protein
MEAASLPHFFTSAVYKSKEIYYNNLIKGCYLPPDSPLSIKIPACKNPLQPAQPVLFRKYYLCL